jgi:hypothetical protein
MLMKCPMLNRFIKFFNNIKICNTIFEKLKRKDKEWSTGGRGGEGREGPVS